MPVRPITVVGVGAVALLGLAVGCGDDDGSDGDAAASTTVGPSSTSTSTATTVSESEAAAPATTTTAELPPGAGAPTPLDPGDPSLEGEGIGDLDRFAPDLLLAAADVGASFVDVGYVPGPDPCGADLDAQVPVDVLVGATSASTAPVAEVRQEIRVYADDTVAGTAFAAAVGTCTEVTDRTAALGFDAFSAPVDGGEVVVVLLSDAVISVAVTGDTATVEPLRAAAAAVEKVLSASAALAPNG